MVETSARKWGNRKKGLSQQRTNFTNRNLALTRWFVGNTIYFSLCLKSPKKSWNIVNDQDLFSGFCKSLK